MTAESTAVSGPIPWGGTTNMSQVPVGPPDGKGLSRKNSYPLLESVFSKTPPP